MTRIHTTGNPTDARVFRGWFDVSNPRPEDVDLRTIAHSLSGLPRFLAHTHRPRTVLAHTLDVAKRAAVLAVISHDDVYEDCIREALIHDAAEAYTGDITRGVRRALGGAVDHLEAGVNAAIREALGLGPIGSRAKAIVQMADDDVLAAELAVYLGEGEQVPVSVRHWGKRESVRMWLSLMRTYCPGGDETDDDTTPKQW